MNRVLPLSLILVFVLSGSPFQTQLTGAAEPTLVIAKLPSATYPPIALAARVWGEVQLSLNLRRDGTVASAEVVSGPPMLRQSALDGVRQTQFDCDGCIAEMTRFNLTYKFVLASGKPCSAHDDSYPRIAQSRNTIAVQDQSVWLCDPGGYTTKRSLKCLYLWYCGRR